MTKQFIFICTFLLFLVSCGRSLDSANSVEQPLPIPIWFGDQDLPVSVEIYNSDGFDEHYASMAAVLIVHWWREANGDAKELLSVMKERNSFFWRSKDEFRVWRAVGNYRYFYDKSDESVMIHEFKMGQKWDVRLSESNGRIHKILLKSGKFNRGF